MRILLPPIPSGPSPLLDEDAPTSFTGKVFRYVPDDDDEPVLLTVTVDAELASEGVPVCTRLVVEPGEYPITRRTLSQVDPRWLARLLLGRMGVLPLVPGDDVRGDTTDTLRGDLRTRPMRHKVTPARLAEVAAAYRHGGAGAVKLECSVSQSQAYRLIRAARDAGVLPWQADTSTEETSKTEVSA